MSCKLLTHPSFSTYIWAIWQGLVGCLLSPPSQSTLLQSSQGFFSISLPYCPHIQNFQHHFLLWFSLEIIGVLKLLGHLVPVFLPSNKGWSVVFESPVWSGFLTLQGLNHNCNPSALFPEVKKTRLDCKKTAGHSFNWSLDWSQSAPVF